MALPTTLVVAVMLTLTASIAADITSTSNCVAPPHCECSGTSFTCRRWPTRGLPSNATSLTVTGTSTPHLTLKRRMSTKLTSLRTLNLTGNNIMTIQKNWFAKTIFPSLEELILDQNRLKLDDKTMFLQVSPNLQLLSLNHSLDTNQTVVIENLKNIIERTRFTKLRVLNLDYNEIGILFPFSMLSKNVSLPKLETFTLRNTSLIGFNSGTFPKRIFPKLKYLDLSDNEMKNIDEGLADFKNFTGLSVSLSGNPFYCNCKLVEFQTWLESTSMVLNKEDLVCNTAFNKSSIGKKVLDATLQCASGLEEIDVEDELQTSYIILSVILAIVGILALIVLYMRRNDIKDYFVELYTNTKEAFNSRQGYDDINRVRRDTPEITPAEV